MSYNPFMARLEKAATNSHGKKSEQRVAKKLGGRLTPASGAMRGAKGDMSMVSGEWKILAEAKSTVHASMVLDFGWLVKISHEARNTGARPLLTVSFVTPEGKGKPSGEWVMMPMLDYQELMEKLEHGSDVAE